MNKKADLDTEVIPKFILYPAIAIALILIAYILINYLMHDIDLSKLFPY